MKIGATVIVEGNQHTKASKEKDEHGNPKYINTEVHVTEVGFISLIV